MCRNSLILSNGRGGEGREGGTNPCKGLQPPRHMLSSIAAGDHLLGGGQANETKTLSSSRLSVHYLRRKPADRRLRLGPGYDHGTDNRRRGATANAPSRYVWTAWPTSRSAATKDICKPKPVCPP